ncbi:DUF6223 family protein [Streptomyces sp. ID05-04B]|uniref:DUF6223 family protein n=1 Tax=unclassified Streptomyces TaxID=2593676 RepID=UPI0020B154D0|nr:MULTISPECIES: DUF6223 family protein [unclassified Streptomyces]MDX5564998.1 DUF6223 family protein [Streptomyces sp. ID05-04B]
MSASAALMAAAEGGIIGDGRTGANLALGVGALGLAFGWLALARAGRRISTGNARTVGTAAIAVGTVGTVLAVLHLATVTGGPGTGNGLLGAVVATPLGLGAVLLGRKALTRCRRASDPVGCDTDGRHRSPEGHRGQGEGEGTPVDRLSL